MTGRLRLQLHFRVVTCPHTLSSSSSLHEAVLCWHQEFIFSFLSSFFLLLFGLWPHAQQYHREKELRKSLKQVDNSIIEEEVELRKRRRANIAHINLHDSSNNNIAFYSGLLPSSPRDTNSSNNNGNGGGGGGGGANGNGSKLLKQLKERKVKIEKELAECIDRLTLEDL